MEFYSDAIKRLKHEPSFYMHEIIRQVIFILRHSTNFRLIQGEFYDEEIMISVHNQANDNSTLFFLYVSKLFLSYIYQDIIYSVKIAKQANNYLEGALGLVGSVIFFFYDSLSSISIYPQSSDFEKNILLKKVNLNQRKIKKWSKNAPMNHQHKFLLVEAERMRVLGKISKAAELYDHAIILAGENEYINEEALANELAAKFYLAENKTKIARAYLHDAVACYSRWGATAKVAALEKEYGRLLLRGPRSLLNDRSIPLSSGSSRIEGHLDLASLVKASQVISSEIVLDQLLNRLMKIVLENAGAQRGVLVLESEGLFFVAAEGTMEHDEVSLPDLPVDQSESLSAPMINYVARTQELLVLSDASREGRFTDDPYVLANQPKSVLCLPVKHKSKLSGILYLENNITTDAFTAEHLEALELLSTQIASSLDNARLYKNLEASELRYRQLYDNIVDMVLLVDDQGKVLMANPCFYKTIGISEGLDSPCTFTDWIYPEDVSKVKNDLLENLENGK